MFRALKTFVVLACFAQGAFAAVDTVLLRSQHEVSGGTVGSLNFNQGTSIGVSGAYNYLVSPGVQIGATAAFGYLGTGALLGNSALVTSATTLTLLAGPTINFPMTDHVNDAAFLSVEAGFVYANIANISATNFAIQGTLGKRFALWDHVSYKPSVSVLKVSGADALFTVTPLAFSFLF